MEEQKTPEIDPSFVEITGYPNYYINRLGQLMSFRKSKLGKILKQSDDGKGYPQVTLATSGKHKSVRVHRLMAKQFLNFNRNMQVNHIDGDKTNNHITNLEMVTMEKNMSHASKNGLIPTGEDHHMSKITKEIVLDIRSSSESPAEIGRKYNLNRSHVHSIRNRKIWKHV